MLAEDESPPLGPHPSKLTRLSRLKEPLNLQVLFPTGPVIRKLRTFTPREDGSDMIRDRAIPRITSISLGETDTIREASARVTCSPWMEAVEIDSCSTVFLSASLRAIIATAMIGSGIPTRS